MSVGELRPLVLRPVILVPLQQLLHVRRAERGRRHATKAAAALLVSLPGVAELAAAARERVLIELPGGAVDAVQAVDLGEAVVEQYAAVLRVRQRYRLAVVPIAQARVDDQRG